MMSLMANKLNWEEGVGRAIYFLHESFKWSQLVPWLLHCTLKSPEKDIGFWFGWKKSWNYQFPFGSFLNKTIKGQDIYRTLKHPEMPRLRRQFWLMAFSFDSDPGPIFWTLSGWSHHAIPDFGSTNRYNVFRINTMGLVRSGSIQYSFSTAVC